MDFGTQVIKQQMAENKLRDRYRERSSKEQLKECSRGEHIPGCDHHQYQQGEFLKDSWPRRCSICGEMLFPDKWGPLEDIESDCKHETIGYYPEKMKRDGKIVEGKLVNRFPQACKHCGVNLIPKTWKPWKE